MSLRSVFTVRSAFESRNCDGDGFSRIFKYEPGFGIFEVETFCLYENLPIYSNFLEN